jgi:hypothetical protein
MEFVSQFQCICLFQKSFRLEPIFPLFFILLHVDRLAFQQFSRLQYTLFGQAFRLVSQFI